MKTYVGILGDPAKYDLYEPDFYRILNWDQHGTSFHLLGASENDLAKPDYKKMFDEFEDYLGDKTFSPIPGLSPPGNNDYTTRIGLFPSSRAHLINGPGFSFAPYPVNSKSTYLKFKSKFLQIVLRPFLPFVVRSLAYLPLGGKAAKKTKADETLSTNSLNTYFYTLRKKNKFDWYYLEAGSGETSLSTKLIDSVLHAQINGITNRPISSSLPSSLDIEPGSRIIVPHSIYGGGIRSVEQVEDLLKPSKNEVKLIPKLIIIGNISEHDVSTTYDIVDKIGQLNELKTYSVNILMD